MAKKQHIDEFFKDWMHGKELPLDGSEWERLAKVIQPEKKKRRAFWWWLLGALLLLALALLVRTIFNENAKGVQPSTDQHNSLSENALITPTQPEAPVAQDDGARPEETPSLASQTPEPYLSEDHSESVSEFEGNEIQLGDGAVIAPSTGSDVTPGEVPVVEQGAPSPVSSETHNQEEHGMETWTLEPVGLNTLFYPSFPPELEPLDSAKQKPVSSGTKKGTSPDIFGPDLHWFPHPGELEHTASQITGWRLSGVPQQQ